MKKTLLSIGITIYGALACAQTNPAPQLVPATGSYVQDFGSLDGNATTYPKGFQGWRITTATPSSAGRTSPPKADTELKSGGTAKTSASGVYDFKGKIGIFSNSVNDYAVVLALNTTKVPAEKLVEVKFDAVVMRNLYDGSTNDFVQGLAFMYRIGTSGPFTLVDNDFINNGEATASKSTSGTAGVNQKSLSFTLPADCSAVPVLQLRWVMRTLSGTVPEKGADRPSFAIDNISVAAVGK